MKSAAAVIEFRELFEQFRGASLRLRGIERSRGDGGYCRGLRRGECSASQSREQRIEHIGNLLCADSSTSRGSARSRMAFSKAPAADCTCLAPMFPATPLSGVRDPFGERNVAACELRRRFARAPDLAARRTGAGVSDTASDFPRPGAGRPPCRARRSPASHPSAARGLRRSLAIADSAATCAGL